jgi:hypothetical protein
MPGTRGVNVAKIWAAEYLAWRNARARCRDTRHNAYPNYGGRGLRVAPEWESFQRFLADMGPRPGPGYSLDRIDNDRGYEPGNCRWSTWRQQHNNRRGNKHIEWNGRRLTVAQWADVTGIPKVNLYLRFRYGWSPDRALTTPVG